MEGKSGGSKPLEDNRTPIHMVGGTPTVQAKLDSVDMLCVVNSGSVVSFITEGLYKKKLQSTCGRVKTRKQMLTLCAANRLEIPYVGYLELEIEVDGVKVPNCGVIVLKDTPATSQKRKDSLEPMFWHRSQSFVPCSNKGLIVSPGHQEPAPLVLFA